MSAYAATMFKDITITDKANNVSYTLNYETRYDSAAGYQCMVTIEKSSITARKGQSPSGSVERKVKIYNMSTPYYNTIDFSTGGADTDCTKTYTASFKVGKTSSWDASHGNTTTVTLTRKAESSHTWGSTWSMVSGSTTKHERECTHPVCVQTDVCEAEWVSCVNMGNGTHKLTCAEGHTVTVACSGGEATCVAAAVCEVCGESYGSTNPRNHKEATAATCVARATCQLCGQPYGSVNPDNHLPGADATCTTAQVCIREGCGKELVAALGHDENGADATCTTDKVCAREGCDYVLVAALGHDQNGADATCTTDKVCAREGCDYVLVEALGHDESGADATCTTDKVCNRAGCDFVLVEALGHDESGADATCTADKVCAREGCDFVLVEALGHDESGADATCITDKVCAREGCGYVLVPAFGHALALVERVEATCTKAGYIDSVCTREGCGMPVHEELKALGHWYDLWLSNIDGTHSADCKRADCKHVGTADCTEWEITVNDVVWTVCPVCGEFGEGELDAIEQATIDCQRKPKGEVIVRGMEAPFEGMLYAFTAGCEYAGRMQEIQTSSITITLPLNAEIGEFTLVRVDVTPAMEEAERAEVWTELAYTFEDGVLSFETETDGLFLLLPVATEN